MCFLVPLDLLPLETVWLGKCEWTHMLHVG